MLAMTDPVSWLFSRDLQHEAAVTIKKIAMIDKTWIDDVHIKENAAT